MSLIHSLLGNAKLVDPAKIEKEFAPLLIQGEEVTAAFQVFRDRYIFTQCRLIIMDKQGVTGKKVEYHSIPYRSIRQFSVETAGSFDMDSELKLWVAGSATPIKKEFKRGTDIVAVQRLLATYIMTGS